MAKQAKDRTRTKEKVSLRIWPREASWKLEESVPSPVTVMSLDYNLSGSCHASFCLVAWLPSEWFCCIWWAGREEPGSRFTCAFMSGICILSLASPALVSFLPNRLACGSEDSKLCHMACDLANNLIPTIHQAVLSHSQGPSNPLSSQKKKWLHRWKNFINMNSVSLPM